MEKDTFTPTVISTSGGVGIEADRHHKRIASLIARKRRQSYADALRYIIGNLRWRRFGATATGLAEKAWN